MSTFQQKRNAKFIVQIRGGITHLAECLQLRRKDRRCFIQVWCYEIRERKQSRLVSLNGIGLHQRITRGGYHDRIDNEERPLFSGNVSKRSQTKSMISGEYNIPVLIDTTGK